jgi:capsular exopolysaccharide synthesis family protein
MATLSQTRSRALIDRFDEPTGADAESARGGATNLHSLATTLRTNALLIGLVLAGAFIVAVVLTLLQTPRYTAQTTVQINAQADQVLGQNQETQQESVNFFDQDRFLQTQLDILQSRALSERVAERLKLQRDPAFYRAIGAEPPAADASPKAASERTGAALRNNLSVDLPRSSRIASIRFTSTNAEVSARVANAYAEEFIASNLQRKFDSSAYARSFVAQQLAEAKNRLENSEVAVNNYARQNGLIRTRDAAVAGDKAQPAGSITTASLLQLNEAANTARAQRIAAQGRWQAVSGGGALNSPEVLSNPTVQQLLAQRADVQAKLGQERVRHLESYPTVVQLRAQASEIERQLGALVGAVRNSVRSQYTAAQNAERQLADQVSGLKTATLSEQDRSVQYNLLAREADTNRTIFDGLLQRFKELNAAAGISASNLLVIDRADVPSQPSSPSLLKNLALALLSGLILSALIVLFRDQFDDSIRLPEDVDAKLELALLGVVPRVSGAAANELADPRSPMSEAYASLGGALLYATGEGLPETLLVTSAQAGEGKSITSLAIANNLARIGKRTVLIDLDLRRPSVARNLGAENTHGMTSLLTGQDTLDGVLLATEQANLSVITSGPLPPSPAELIAGPRLQAVIDELADRFDAVVIDSPPVLGLADAPLLSALVDGVVVVVEAGRSRRGALKASLRRLRAMRPILVGAVLTKFDPRKGANKYSDYYAYAHYGEDAGTKGRAAA